MKTAAPAMVRIDNQPSEGRLSFKSTFNSVGKFLTNLFLLIFAIVFTAIMILPAAIWKIWVSIEEKKRKLKDILEASSEFVFNLALSVDNMACVIFCGLFNDLFLTNKTEFPFGQNGVSISQTFGWNNYLGNLNSDGKFMKSFINFWDFSRKNHCEHAMIIGIISAKNHINKYDKNFIPNGKIEDIKNLLEKYK